MDIPRRILYHLAVCFGAGFAMDDLGRAAHDIIGHRLLPPCFAAVVVLFACNMRLSFAALAGWLRIAHNIVASFHPGKTLYSIEYMFFLE